MNTRICRATLGTVLRDRLASRIHIVDQPLRPPAVCTRTRCLLPLVQWFHLLAAGCLDAWMLGVVLETTSRQVSGRPRCTPSPPFPPIPSRYHHTSPRANAPSSTISLLMQGMPGLAITSGRGQSNGCFAADDQGPWTVDRGPSSSVSSARSINPHLRSRALGPSPIAYGSLNCDMH